MKARCRGIYATALTGLFLEAGHDVVDASPPIRERFDADVGDGAPDVSIETTGNRQGVGVAGDEEAVAEATDLLSELGLDAFAWDDPTPRGAVFDGVVTETLGRGVVVDLGTREGYLPSRNADDHVDEGDALRVQVRESIKPWGSNRPELDTEIHATSELVSLVPGEGTRVDSYDDAAGRELAGMTDLLDLEPPDGWGVHWHQPAVDAGMDALESGLSGVVARAEAIEAAIEDDVGDPGPVVVPAAGSWLWFGRESRFALDERRRETVSTMPGHHRVKAGSEAASAGVDFAEALCEPSGEFPFGVTVDQFGPYEGGSIRLEHGKPDGRLIVLGEGDVSELDTEAGSLTVTRQMSPGGSYDALGVERESGDTAVTKVKEGRWWYPTTYRDADGSLKGTYVNVCTPVEVFPDAVRYVDLHVDVIKRADGTVERVDEDRLQESVEDGNVSEELAEKARSVASAIENAL